MAEPTTTLATLRQIIARSEGLKFFQFYPSGSVNVSGVTSAQVFSSNELVQVDNYWRNCYVYFTYGANAGTQRRIREFSDAGDSITLDYALTYTPQVGDSFSIYDQWPPVIIDNVINRAIERASRVFSETLETRNLVLQDSKMSYDLAGLVSGRTVHRIQKVKVERLVRSTIGKVDGITPSSGNYVLTDTDVITQDDAFNGWLITFYAGTGTGRQGVVVSTSAATHSVTITLTGTGTVPTAGAAYRLSDPSYQVTDLDDVHFRYQDNPDFPDTLYLSEISPADAGYRLVINFTALPGPLVADTDATPVPKELIVNRARAFLHEDMMLDTRADLTRHKALADYFHQQADSFIQQNMPVRPPSQQLLDSQGGGAPVYPTDPLGWS